MDPTIDPDQPIAWLAVAQDTPVRSADGAEVGRVWDVLASEQEDIFHGIVVHLDSNGNEVFVPADDVILMTPSYLEVSYTSDQLAGLPEHTEQRQAELGWSGRFRRDFRVEDADR